MFANTQLNTLIIHLIKITPNAGATTLKNTISTIADNTFHVPSLQKNFLADSEKTLFAYQTLLGEEKKSYLEAEDKLDETFQRDEASPFCVCMFTHEGNSLQAKIWDDTTAAKFDKHYKKEVPDVQLFLVDLTCIEEEREQIETELKTANRRSAPTTIRLLVANKVDEVRDTNYADSIAALAETYGFDHAIISAKSASDVTELMQEVFTAVFRLQQQLPTQSIARKETTDEKHAREQMQFRSQLIEKTVGKINATPTRLFGKATTLQKLDGLTKLIEKFSQDKEQSIADIIASVRHEFPEIDKGIFSKQTHQLLEGFINDEKEFVTKSPGRRHG